MLVPKTNLFVVSDSSSSNGGERSCDFETTLDTIANDRAQDHHGTKTSSIAYRNDGLVIVRDERRHVGSNVEHVGLARAAIVGAGLGAVAEPVVNTVLTKRVTVSVALKEFSYGRAWRMFWEATLPTNLIKFPFYELVHTVQRYHVTPERTRCRHRSRLYHLHASPGVRTSLFRSVVERTRSSRAEAADADAYLRPLRVARIQQKLSIHEVDADGDHVERSVEGVSADVVSRRGLRRHARERGGVLRDPIPANSDRSVRGHVRDGSHRVYREQSRKRVERVLSAT